MTDAKKDTKEEDKKDTSSEKKETTTKESTKKGEKYDGGDIPK
jgi:hypothetical protein